ncbi:unnamed protein product [Clavelina lepadiformis]|uniref:FLYWCH-type domain-containing protein n=1 Tax=Clavelina lepadiformis TaxID=159417 RepID=A0ABP0FHF9_CLALP
MNTGLRLISSTREKDKLELNNGESFVYDRESKDGILTFWRCYKRGKCKARLHLTKEALERLKNEQSIEPSSWKTLGRHIHDKTARSYQSRRPFNTTIPDSTQNNTTSDTSVIMPSSDQFPCSSNQLSSVSNTQREGPSAAGQNIADYDYSEISQVLLLSRASREVENLSTNGTSQQPNQEIHFNQQQQIVNVNSSASSQLHGIQTVQQNTINPPNFSTVSTTTCTSTTGTLISPRCQPPLAKKSCYGNHSNTSNLFQRETSNGQSMLCNSLPSSQTTHGQNLQNMTQVTSDHRLLSSGSYFALRNTLKVAGNPRPQLSRQHMKNLLKTMKFSLSKVIAIVDCNSYCEIECNTREDVVDLFDLLKSHKTNLNITVELYKKENICVNLEFVSRILDERFLLSYFQENHGSVSDSGLTWESDEDGILNGKCTVLMRRRDLDRRPIPDKIVINGREIQVRYEDQAIQAQLLPPNSHAVSIEPENFNAYASAEPELVENEPISANQPPRVPSSVSTSSCMDSENVSPPVGFQHVSFMPRASTPFTITPQVISSQFLPVGSPIPSFASVRATRFNRPMVTACYLQQSLPQPSPQHVSRFFQPLHNFGNTQQSRLQPSPQQTSRFVKPPHNYHMNYNNNHGLQARHPINNIAPSYFQQATRSPPPISNQVQPALPQQPHRNLGYDTMTDPPLAHPGGASQHSDPSQHSQVPVVPIQDMYAGASGTVVQVGGFIPTMSREPDEAALQIPNQNSQLLSTSQTGGVGQPLTNQNNEFDSQQPTHEECRQNMMDTSFVNSGGYAQHSTTLEYPVAANVLSPAMPIIGNLGTTDSIGNNISSLNQNFHEVEQPASNQYTELQSTSKSQQQQTDEENRVDVEEAASMQRSDLSEVEDSESDNLSSDSSDGEADDDMSGNSLYGSVGEFEKSYS